MYVYTYTVEIAYVIFLILKMSIDLVSENSSFFSGGCFYFAKLGFLKFLMLLTIFGRFLCFLKPCYSVCFSCILKFRCEQAFPNVIHSWKDKQFIQPKNCCQRHLGSSELHVRPPSSGNTNSDLLVVWSDK